MEIVVRQAKREKLWTKVLLFGPSGSGKTYTALRLASGMVKKTGGKIFYVDTENRRSCVYADEFNFDVVDLEAEYTPESYIEAIEYAVKNGYKVIVIDSASHEWNYLLDTSERMGGNKWHNWSKLKPRHGRFMEEILQADAHVIVTARGKDQWETEDKDGKTIPKKVGVGSQQDKDIEYNYTVSFNLDQETHIATCFKDNTHLFEGKYNPLTENDGEKIIEWANSGDTPAPRAPVKAFPARLEDNIDGALNSLKELFSSKMASGVDKEELYNIVSKYHTSKNFMTIKDINVVNAIKEEMENK